MSITLLAATPGAPVPAGRGRWRVQLLKRSFSYYNWSQNVIAELNCRSRRLEQAWNSSATFSFTIDGRSPEAASIAELQQDVMVWRWDEATGGDVCMFRGIIAQAVDQVTEQSHTINITCHDYLAMLARRIITRPLSYVQTDQDTIAVALMLAATNSTASDGTAFNPGSYLPLTPALVNPAGQTRPQSGVLRDRNYTASSVISEQLDNLATVLGGFDYDVLPAPTASMADDALRIFYPYQGVLRSSPVLMYGTTVSGVTRTVNSGDFTNYWRSLGNNGSEDPDTPQLYAEAWDPSVNNVTVVPIGLWMSTDDEPDVTLQQTLIDKANGNLNMSSVLVPSYALTLRPNAYSYGNPNMGDTVPLIIQSGRINVNSNVRVLGITFDVGDDGEEDISLTVGRPDITFSDLLIGPVRDVNALSRR